VIIASRAAEANGESGSGRLALRRSACSTAAAGTLSAGQGALAGEQPGQGDGRLRLCRWSPMPALSLAGARAEPGEVEEGGTGGRSFCTTILRFLCLGQRNPKLQWP